MIKGRGDKGLLLCRLAAERHDQSQRHARVRRTLTESSSFNGLICRIFCSVVHFKRTTISVDIRPAWDRRSLSYCFNWTVCVPLLPLQDSRSCICTHSKVLVNELWGNDSDLFCCSLLWWYLCWVLIFDYLQRYFSRQSIEIVLFLCRTKHITIFWMIFGNIWVLRFPTRMSVLNIPNRFAGIEQAQIQI